MVKFTINTRLTKRDGPRPVRSSQRNKDSNPNVWKSPRAKQMTRIFNLMNRSKDIKSDVNLKPNLDLDQISASANNQDLILTKQVQPPEYVFECQTCDNNVSHFPCPYAGNSDDECFQIGNIANEIINGNTESKHIELLTRSENYLEYLFPIGQQTTKFKFIDHITNDVIVID